MSDSSNVSLKFGGDYAAPWYTVYGTPEQIREQLIQATALDPEYAKDLTLAQVIIEASRWARGLYAAAEKLTEPPAAKGAEPKKKAAPKGGLAAQAKAAAETTEPHQVTDSIESLIANAMSTDELNDIYNKHEAQWTEEFTALGQARAEEITK